VGAATAVGVDRRGMAVLSLAHMFTDVCQGSVPALLPFLIVERHLSYAAASALVLAATLASSVIQPVFGHLSDRRSLPVLMPAGLACGAVGIALVGVAPTYGALFAAIALSGVGVAAFHPEASRFAHHVSGARRASGMSLFSVGGNAGFALGPLLTTPLVLVFGLPGTLFLIVPLGLMALLLARELGRLRSFAPAPAATRSDGPERDRLGAFVLLAGVVALRSFVYFGLVTFVPLYYVGVLHASKAAGNGALAVMLIGGAVGTLLGGPLADRFGRSNVIVGSMALLPGLIGAFLSVGGVAATLLLGVVGAVTIATFSVTIVMGQELLPRRLGVASGVTIGLSIGLGGAGAPLLGLIADAHGLPTTIAVIAALPVPALVLALALPRPRAGARPAGEGARRRGRAYGRSSGA